VRAAQDTGGVALEEPFVRLDLLEREAELTAVAALLDTGAPSLRGRLLTLEGPPGIGKTSLLQETRRRAQRAGLDVLGARGSELEASFSFGVVRQLFEPFVAQLPESERAELLTGAAELATPLFEPMQLANEGPPEVSLAMLHGLYWLTANASARRPLLIAVDDLHWCDPPSLRWLAYLLPRLEGLDVALVVTLRSSEPGEDPALVGQIVSDPLATVLRPAPLTAEAVARLARETLSPDAEEDFSLACFEATGGNPLLVHELLNAVVAEGLDPLADNVPALGELAPLAGWRAVSVRLSRLPPEATRLAQAVAILGDDADPHQAAELADLDEQAASVATAALVRVDILQPSAPLAFVHQLMRGAVYEALTPHERDRGHARAAHLLLAAEVEPDRVAAHLLRVPPAGDPRVVTVLREAAKAASCRGASESAVTYLRRALAEPPTPEERGEVLLQLGYAEALVNGEAAVEHLTEAHELVSDPVRRAKAALMLGRQLFFLRVDESVTVFTDALAELDGAEPELARILESGLITNALFEPSLYPEARRRLDAVRRSPVNGSLSEKMLLALLAFHDARANVPASAAVGLARRALADRTLLPWEVSSGPFILASIVLALADRDEAMAMYDAAVADAHRRGSIIAFAAAKAHRAEMFVYRGDLAEAEVEGREALAACDTWGMAAAFPPLLAAFLSETLMEQGRLDEAESILARGGFGEAPPGTVRPEYFLDRRARFRLLSGDLTGGLEEMLAAGSRFEAVGGRNPAFMPWRSQAALALLQLGDRDEAGRLADEEVALARTWGAPRALGAALRAAGLVRGGNEGLALLEEAVAVLAESPAKLEHAKARTELGAALRRANRRSAAREHLRRAVELASLCGAVPLVSRAEAELLATGARPRRVALSGLESLTPSERRVAEMASEGPTNREIAQALFVTPKTVEVHLSSVYRKLGISSRGQLANALSARRAA
jgi:DNA-binding CsgD family transcriptional regulator